MLKSHITAYMCVCVASEDKTDITS